MKFLLSLLITISLTSCATYKTVSTPQQHKLITYKKIEKNEKCVSIPRPYSGIFYSGCVMSGHVKTMKMQESILMLPLNFVADTLMLPYTITRQFKDGNIVLKKDIGNSDLTEHKGIKYEF